MKNKTICVPESLQTFFREHTRIALAFSGGCDSAYLLYAAHACGAELGIYHVHSCFQPEFELEDARRLADEYGYELKVLEADVLADENIRANPGNRCYYCKRRIFSEILRAAKDDGYTAVIDGTNASDDASDRPGMRALQEMQVASPLRLCRITKAQVRELSRQAGVFTWNKPAYACLATRIPTGMPIERAMLEKVERAEATMESMGFSGFRVRVNAGGAKLEILEEQMPMLLEKRSCILAALESDFEQITLDLHPRREQ